MVAKNDSATALSKHEPVRPTDGRIALLRQNPRNSSLVYQGHCVFGRQRLELGLCEVIDLCGGPQSG
jgi:hypothetical protein